MKTIVNFANRFTAILVAMLMFALAPMVAHAAGGFATGNFSTHQGQGGGYTETATVGGSQANTGSYGAGGFATMSTKNAGDTYAHAGANISPDGVNSYSSGGSFSTGTSVSDIRGPFANGQTTGAVGNDFSGKAWGTFGTAGGGFIADANFGKF